MFHQIYLSVIVVCVAVVIAVHVLEDSGAIKKNDAGAVVGGIVVVIGFLTVVAWILTAIWS